MSGILSMLMGGESAGAPPAWTPASEGSNLIIWLKAEAGRTLGTGSNVVTWASQTPATNNFTSADSTDVTYNATGFNGGPGIVIAGTTNRLVNTSVSLNSATYSLFIVFNASTLAAANERLWSLLGSGKTNDYGNNASFVIAQNSATGGLYAYGNNAYMGSTAAQAGPAEATNSWLSVICNGTTVSFYIANASCGTATAWTTPLGNTTAAIRLGCDQSNGVMWKGTYAEVGFSISAINQTDLASYISGKYGL